MFRVLGPVEMPSGADLPPRLRAVLAFLLLRAPQPVTAAELIDALWGEEAPSSARGQVQVAMSKLREALGEHRSVLGRRGGGYTIDPPALDLAQFTAVLNSRDAGRIREALGLWRGPALADVDAPYTASVRPVLEEHRVSAWERLAALEAEAGQAGRLVPELSELAAAHPIREPLHYQLVQALAQAGRRAEALTLAGRFRARLAEEVGLDPGQEFAALEAGLREPAPSGPMQLPGDIPGFTGRAEQLDLLDSLLPDHGVPGASAAVITAIAGVGGVGKTALAVHWARQVAARFPDGQLYVNLHGYGASMPLRPAEAIGRLLRSLGLAPREIPVELAEATAVYQKTLAARRVLVILDNACEPGQVRPLLPPAGGSLALITSRDRLAGLVARDGARRITLEAMSEAEALALLAVIIGAGRVQAEPAAAAELAGLCGYLPLALRILGEILADRPELTLAEQAAGLRAGRLAGLEVGGDVEASVRAVFGQSCQRLAPEDARLFRLLGLLPGPDCTAESAAALAGTEPHLAERSLGRLAAAHLVTEYQPGRYQLHDLLQEYAVERVAAEETEAGREAAVSRLLDWYLVTAHQADCLINVLKVPRPDPPAAYQPPALPFAPDKPGALDFLDGERFNLLPVVELAARQPVTADGTSRAAEIAVRLKELFVGRGYHAGSVDLYEIAVAEASRLGLAALEVDLRVHLAMARGLTGRRDLVWDELDRALAIDGARGTLSEAAAHFTRGQFLLESHRFAEAVGPFERAIEIRKASGNEALAVAQSSLGLAHLATGDLEQASAHLEDAMRTYEQEGNGPGSAYALEILAIIAQRREDIPAARGYLERALVMARESGQTRREGSVLHTLGEISRQEGDFEAALGWFGAALPIRRQVGDSGREALDLQYIGEAHLRLGRPAEAREHLLLAGQARALAPDPEYAAQIAALLAEIDGE
ncbi:AfsR/SARP family transcriptional regulator [Longispora albida]|uniref:AfsR/SARP family transcriptional regulator n=1 Tax=Longispora albida TaxID=203523 RepID=UPI001FE23ED7|nr:BTAD domain-containing putative transcriptional regulator [Longispora albida]